ncbi:hypothetical protein ASE12_12790 [Aeromicrobium sp. Root236]|nr:hypothetical protein ASE12_12790 [Aeromicrobium sp. Root236]
MTDWHSDPQWQTVDQREATSKISELDAEHAEAARVYQARRAELEMERLDAAKRAELGARRLLEAQGDTLKDEVAEAFREFGFTVEDADKEHAKKGDLLEDLRVLDPDDPDWVALVEVRGYSGGAKLSDLQRITRFATRFAAANRRVPSACWYVVNHFLGTDPGKRDEPLASNEEEVATFNEDGGLIIGTPELFVLRERVRRGDLTAAEALAQLKTPGRLRTA